MKWSSWVVPIGTQQIQHGGRPPLKKLLNRHISATVGPILTKFGMVTHIGHGSGSTVKILNSWKSKMAATAFLKNHKIAISPQRFDRSLRNVIRWCKIVLLTFPTVKKFKFRKSKMADGRHFKNLKIAISLHSATVWPMLMKYVKLTHIGSLQQTDR